MERRLACAERKVRRNKAGIRKQLLGRDKLKSTRGHPKKKRAVLTFKCIEEKRGSAKSETQREGKMKKAYQNPCEKKKGND